MIIRVLTLASVACIAGAVALVIFGEDNTPLVAALVLAGFGISSLLGIRAGYHKARGIVRDATAFVTGDIQQARLVSVGEPQGLFTPESTVTLELS